MFSQYNKLAVIVGVITILASEATQAAINFTQSSASVLESAGSFAISVTRSGVAPNTAASVSIVVTHGTATSGTDYVITGATLNWAVGETGIKTTTVTLNQDALAEGTETAYFALTSVTGDTLGTQDTFQLSILDPNTTTANDPNLPPHLIGIAGVLDKVCATSAGKIEGCNLFETLSDAQQIQALESMLPRHVVQQGSNVSVAQSGSNQAIRMRMQNVRAGNANSFANLNLMSGGQNHSLAGLLNNQDYLGGSAGGDGVGERWGVFMSGQLQSTDQDSTTEILGYQSDSQQIVAGIDYRMNNQWFVGTALSYSQANTDSNADSGSQDSSITIMNVFSSYYWTEQLYMDAVVSIGASDFDMARNYRFGDTSALATSTTSGDQWGVSLGGGYEYAKSFWQLGGFARVDVNRVTVEAYDEMGGAGLGLGVHERDANSTRAIFGGSVALVKSVAFGVLMPKLSVEWVQEIGSDPEDITAHFVASPESGSFSIAVPESDSNYFNVGGSLVAVFSHGMSAYLRYEAVVGRDDYSSGTFDLGGRWGF